MHHFRSTVFVALAAMGAATTILPLEARAKQRKKAGKAKGRQVVGKGGDTAASKAARMEEVGKRAYRKGKYGDALIAFEAAFDADPQPKHLYNMARCHEQQGNLAKAADFYERYLREAPDAEDSEDVETRAEFLTTKLKKTMARLEVTSEQDGTALHIEGSERTWDVKTPWSGWLEPGRYELSILLPDHEERTQKVGLSAGEDRRVEIGLEEPPAGRPGAAASSVGGSGEEGGSPPEVGATGAPGASSGSGDGLGLVPLAAFGLAAVGLASWGVFGGLHLSKAGEVEEAEDARRASGKTRGELQDAMDSANLFGVVANVSLAVAATAGLTGGALLLLGGGGETTSAAVGWTW